MKQSSLVHLERGGCYLMLHRVKKKNDINHDKWIGVGGKVEEGESPDDCARRETWEETGYVPGKLEYRCVVTFVPDNGENETMHVFTCTDFAGTERECAEGELAWVEKEKIADLPIWEGDKIFLRLIAENHPFFYLRLEYQGDTLVSAVLDGQELVKKEPVLVSACLLGVPCRYDGLSKPCAALEALKERYALIPFCPEQAGGLPTPRKPAERVGDRVLCADGTDVSKAYQSGAEKALTVMLETHAHKAILKENSPSCGKNAVYDGTFSRRLIPGRGVTAELLQNAGMTVWDETEACTELCNEKQ